MRRRSGSATARGSTTSEAARERMDAAARGRSDQARVERRGSGGAARPGVERRRRPGVLAERWRSVAGPHVDQHDQRGKPTPPGARRAAEAVPGAGGSDVRPSAERPRSFPLPTIGPCDRAPRGRRSFPLPTDLGRGRPSAATPEDVPADGWLGGRAPSGRSRARLRGHGRLERAVQRRERAPRDALSHGHRPRVAHLHATARQRGDQNGRERGARGSVRCRGR